MNKVIIIAEAGVNHNGDIALAKQLIDAAKIAKVDYVKFQTFKSENVVTLDEAGDIMMKRHTIPCRSHSRADLMNLKLGYPSQGVRRVMRISSGKACNVCKPF